MAITVPPWPSRSLLIFLSVLVAGATIAAKVSADGSTAVTYDGRSLLINGKREIFFSGAIHYPRSTPEMWEDLIQKGKAGGLNTIETYAFWNVHETAPGQFSFDGKYDIVKFIKLIQKNEMYSIIRLGPFIQAEWNHGGFPYWLREVPGIFFRTDNEPFKFHMQRFVTTVVNLLKKENLFAPQGGPIILAQIENEYNNIAGAYKQGADSYIRWAANMALALNTGVPWVMCKQNDAPGDVINSCNGRNCGDTWPGPNSPNKPSLWTENWTAQFRVFGDPPSQRAAEDISYSVARFFSKNGTLVNYYMFHGGTNLARHGASFMMTRYYDEAPLDEFGLLKEPKYGHLRDLHQVLRMSKKTLLFGDYSVQNFKKGFEARLYEKKDENLCIAFLTNTNPKKDGSITFRGITYDLPRRSISILPDCKNVIYNTNRANAQHNSRTFNVAKGTDNSNNKQWYMYQEPIPNIKSATFKVRSPMELFNLTKDTTDYAWYSTSFQLDEDDQPRREDIRAVIQVSNLGHAMHIFVNGKYTGSGHGTKVEKSFVYQGPLPITKGTNQITLLCVLTGLQDSGAFLEHRKAGPHTVMIQGLNTGTLDLSSKIWGHQVGLNGEKLSIFTEQGTNAVKWQNAAGNNQATWYKRYFDAPNGNDPVTLDMTSMGKGLIWVNGECTGRYWVSYESPLGKPSQSMYHIPRSYLKPKDNLLVIFEEHTGNPEGIVFMIVKRDNICSVVSQLNPGNIKAWMGKTDEDMQVPSADELSPEAHLECGPKKMINRITFASFGNPYGACGNFSAGNCHSRLAKNMAEKACLRKNSCTLPVSFEAYAADKGCPGTTGTLAIQAKCSRGGNDKKDDDSSST